MKTHEKLKEEVKKLIGDNKTERAIKMLTEKKLPSIEKELILINSRHSKVTEEQRLGISEEDDIQRKLNKINFDLLALVEQIGVKPPAVSSSTTVTSSGETKSNNKTYLLIAGGLLVAALAGWGIMSMQNSPKSPTVNTTNKESTNSKSVSTSENETKTAIADKTTKTDIKPATSDLAPKEAVPKKEDSNIIYKIGMEHEGGKIFYLDPTGKHGLIMAPIDMPEGAIYWQNNDGPVEKAGATSSGFKAGKLNTKDLIEKFGPGDYPAQLCDKYSRRGFSDWYLPSKMELIKLYEYSLEHPNELSNNSYYWSSTEMSNPDKDVYYKNFRTGEEYFRLPISNNNYKRQNKARVRAIRSF